MENVKSSSDLHLYPYLKYKNYTLFPWSCLVNDAEGHFKKMKAFPVRDDDVLLCTIPKSGTHWVSEILSMLIEHTTEYNCKPSGFEIHLEYLEDTSDLEAETRRRLLHSHLPFQFQPEGFSKNKGKIVYVNRNPKDRHLSLYLHFRQLKGFPKDWTWEQYFNDGVLNDTLLTGWFNYTKEFTEAIKQHNNIHQVLYEDLKINPVKEVKRLAEFLNVKYDDDFINRVVDACSFNKLKNEKHDASAELHEKSVSTVFRKGQIGEWKQWFTVAQNEKFDKLYEEEMKGVDIKFTYENP